ncbi:MAG: NAD(+)/NADH kinase [Thermaerobacter sp.]|nr:NAD(+)/NADH kinase [Thermaerobacter sp.]
MEGVLQWYNNRDIAACGNMDGGALPVAVTVGIIANPAAGKDIRRLVSEATVVTAPEKVALLRRALVGIGAAGVDRVLYLRDAMHLVDQALAGLSPIRRPNFTAEPLELPLRRSPDDTRRAARAMRDAGVAALLVLGGDGTSRLVAPEIGDLPLLPMSTGTNNAFPLWAEATAAGLALGVVARGLTPEALVRRKRIAFAREGAPEEWGLVDAVVLRPSYHGTQAVWDPDDVEQIVVTQATPGTVGWSAVIAALEPLSITDPQGARAFCSPTAARRAVAAIGPGLVEQVGVTSFERLPLGVIVPVGPGPRSVALDGEPIARLLDGEQAQLCVLQDGPVVIEIATALALAASRGAFTLGG